MSNECTEQSCNYLKYLNKDVRALLKKHKATWWTSGCEDNNFGIEISPKRLAAFLKDYDKLKLVKKVR